MLADRHRMVRSADFSRCVRRGSRGSSRTLTVHLLPRPEQGGTTPVLVGLVVAKSVGNAVHRNRVQRQVRHLVRDRVESLDDIGLLVVRALPAAHGALSAELGSDLDQAIETARRRAARRTGSSAQAVG